MIFPILASLVFAAGLVAVLLRTFSFKLLKLALLATLLLGIYFVWRPEDLTGLANVLGIDRGADLVSYLSTIVLLLFIVSASINARQVDRRITLLARKMAIASVQSPCDHDKTDN